MNANKFSDQPDLALLNLVPFDLGGRRRGTFADILYVTLLALAAMDVAPVRTPKLTGGWYYGLVIYASVMTAVFGWRWAQLP